jgi:uncharacterized protein YjbJ (UPF0337 family)
MVKTHCLINANERRPAMGLGDKISNEAENMGGKAKEAAGNATDNDRLKAEGQADQVKADAKKVGEDIKDTFKKD